jgi:hypothetical protein
VRAQSETLGFVFVFALILLSVGVVTTFGVSELQDLREDERTNNVQRAFDVLDSNMEDIYQREAPSRATEMKLAGGTLGLADVTTLNVTFRNTSDPADNATVITETRPIAYDDGDGTRFVYELGATFRSDAGRTLLLDGPGWLADRNRVLVPMVTVEERGSRTAVSGGTALLIGLRGASGVTGTLVTDAGASADVNVTVTVESPRATAWGEYLADSGFTAIDADGSDGEVTYFRHTDAGYVHQTVVSMGVGR